jgi:hypothetical protein
VWKVQDVWKLLEHLWSNALQAGVGNVECGELNSKSMSVKAGDVEKAIDKKMGEPIINALAANWTEQQQEGNGDKEPPQEGHRLPTIPHAVCSCEWGWGGSDGGAKLVLAAAKAGYAIVFQLMLSVQWEWKLDEKDEEGVTWIAIADTAIPPSLPPSLPHEQLSV